MRILSIVLIALLITGASALAQEKQKLAEAQQSNSAALKQYTWKSRTELKLKGESKTVKLEQVRYDLTGNIQETDIGGTPEAQPSSQPARGLRGRAKEKIIEKKKNEFAELMQNLAGLVLAYVHMSPEQTQAFSQNATLIPNQTRAVIIRGSNVLQREDSVTMWVNPQTLLLQRLEIRTALENKLVHFVADFEAVSNGPTHMKRAKLDYPEKGIELIVENYDYQRLGS